MEAYICSLGSYLPSRRVSNHELAEIVDTSDEWIYSHTGIRFRHLAGEEQAASDLGVEAAQRALKAGGVSADELDLILLATSTPDYPGLPATACVVQDRLGAKHAAAMDLVAACSGFAYALSTARAFITAGQARNVMVIGSEVYSKILNWKDRNTCVLFGDGAGAALVSAAEDGGKSRILDSYLRSRGAGATALYRSHGGSRNAYIPGTTPAEELYLKMNGRQVYNFAVPALVETIETLLERNGKSMADVAWIVPHHANVRILHAAAKRGGYSFDRFYVNIEENANTSAASIPIAMDEMYRKGMLTRGDLILTVGFGAGLTYGGNLIAW